MRISHLEPIGGLLSAAEARALTAIVATAAASILAIAISAGLS